MSTSTDRDKRTNAATGEVRPYEHTLWHAVWGGLVTYRGALVLALLAAWTGLAAAVELAALGALLGAGATLVTLHNTLSAYATPGPFWAGIDGAVALAAAGAGALAGAVGGVSVVYGGSVLAAPDVIKTEVWTGLVFTVIVTIAIYVVEPWLLTRRGYRRLAWQEDERVTRLLTAAAETLLFDIDTLPRVLIKDTLDPGAWAQMRVIVLTRGLLDLLDDDELAGVLCHELHHWHAGHPVGQRLVWAAALPLVLAQSVALWVQGFRSGLVRLIGWLLFWPVHALIRFAIAPTFAARGRSYEYRADAAAAQSNEAYREGLERALTKLSLLEAPRNGWEATLIRSHPPTALRIERLASSEEREERERILAARALPRQQRRSARW